MRFLEKDKIKSLIVAVVLITIIELIIIDVVTTIQYNTNNKLTNKKISQVVGKVEQVYPNVTEADIIDVLNSNVNSDEQLSKYGLNVEKSIIINESESLKNKYIVEK